MRLLRTKYQCDRSVTHHAWPSALPCIFPVLYPQISNDFPSTALQAPRMAACAPGSRHCQRMCSYPFCTFLVRT